MSSEQLRLAASAGTADQVKALLKAGARIDADAEGRTALHLASANGHAAVVKLLIDGGAKSNALDAAGYSPLHQAATEGHEEVAKLLIKHGCHVDTQDELHGNTSLHEAAWKGFSRTLEILCRNKANVYIKNNGGFTALHLACQNGHNQCCRILLLSACKPDVRNNQYGDTPLHTAARYGHAGVLRILISAFCNVNETNKNGDTALHISAAMGRNKLTRILLEAGCDQKLKNNQGETARDIAERKEFAEVVKLMDNPPVTLIHVQQQEEEKTKKSSHKSKKREKDSGTSQESKEKKEKHKKSKKNHKVHFSDKEKKGNVSPYGCHQYPDMNYFPSIKLKSLPQEPLQSGEQYYADLAGNIKKGPRGLGYMCYCAPFFNHVERKLDANKQELLQHIDSRNEDLKAKLSHLERRTHDQLFSLNQKMKESLALERADCAERIDRRLLRERRDSKVSVCNGGANGFDAQQQPLTRSKSEDLLSETNSQQNSVSLLSSTVTGTSRFTNNSHFNRAYLNNPSGAKPKAVNHISRLKMRCMGYPELKRESRSEGDLTSCHTDVSKMDSSHAHHQKNGRANFDAVRSKFNTPENGALWRNTKLFGAQENYRNPPTFPQNVSGNNVDGPPTFCTNHNHERGNVIDYRSSSQIRTQTNGLPNGQRDVSLSGNNLNGNGSERGNILPPTMDADGSSFV